MRIRQWWDRKTIPVCQPISSEQYERMTPAVMTLGMALVGYSLWRHHGMLLTLTLPLVVLWALVGPLVLPIQRARWQGRHRISPMTGPGEGSEGASSGVPRRPLLPSGTASAARGYPSTTEPPAV